MIDDILAHLGLAPKQVVHLGGNLRNRLISFLLRWEYYEEALACLEELVAAKPTLVSFLDDRARAQLALGQHDAALDTMHARQRIRSSLSSESLLARIHLARGDTSAALALAAQLATREPGAALTLSLLGDVYLACGDIDRALAAYQRLQSAGGGHMAYLLGMMRLYEARGELITASSYAVRVQQSRDPDRSLPAYHLRRLRDYYQRSGERNRAQDLELALGELYERELAQLRAAIAGQAATATQAPHVTAASARSPALPAEEPLPLAASPAVSAEERERLAQAAHAVFGHAALLPGQAETMAAILRGQDVLTILPTGGGKSLCYQLPAAMDRRGITLVVSPLIALMKDQVESLPPDLGCRTTTLNSTLDGDELHTRMAQIGHGNYCLVYAAPERMRQVPFLRALRAVGLSRLVIDEAHCVSLWGHDFRPDYLYLGRVRRLLGSPPVLAMTATAPPRVRSDILQRLSGPTAGIPGRMAVVAGDTFRPNLFLEVVRLRNGDEKLARLLAICQEAQGSGIVYVNSRARSERLTELLHSKGIAAGYYHAGIGDRQARDEAQDRFMSGEVRVMVATIAFGMGIDKPDIRWILHYDLPNSLETYYQEAGRAGRDGQGAHCILFYAPGDRGTLTMLAKRDALTVDTLRAVYAAVKKQLGGAVLGRVVVGDLMREVQAEDTPVRVALGMLDDVGLLRRHQDMPRTALVRRRRDRGRDLLPPDQEAALGAFVSAARLETGEMLRLDLLEVARRAGLDPLQIEEQVLHWADAGLLDYRAAGRDALIEVLPAPADAPGRVEALLDRYASIQTQRIDEVVAYAKADRCRQGHISAYLSGRGRERCSSCDRCEPDLALHARATDPGLPDEREQLQAILRCLAEAPWGWGRVNLTHILRGDSSVPDQARGSAACGSLAYRSASAIGKLIDRLERAGMLHARHLEHGGVVLGLTPLGREALQSPERLDPLVEPRPVPVVVSRWAGRQGAPGVPVAGGDPPGETHDELFERLRAWRRAVAEEEGVPAFVVAHDALLGRIAMLRPRNEAQLDAIKGMGPKQMAKYGAAILALVHGPEDPEDQGGG